jgi:RNA polymerase sigma-70 factor, ECF subfamily
MIDQAERIYERVLVVRAQAGDEAALGELVERFSPRLRYFLRKLLGPASLEGAERHGGRSLQNDARGRSVRNDVRGRSLQNDVEDVLQDVWLDVVRGLARLEDPQALVAWLYRIARDKAYGRLRKARRLELPLDEAQLAEEPVEDSAEDFSAEDAATIHAALDELRPEQREVLVLRFLEEMSYEQIARVVGCRVGTVRSRIHYAKRALRERVRGSGRG